VKITKTTICGTDLHILKGDVPTCKPGRVLGHDGIGVVDSVGHGVTAFRPGDHVLIVEEPESSTRRSEMMGHWDPVRCEVSVKPISETQAPQLGTMRHASSLFSYSSFPPEHVCGNTNVFRRQ
jgi:threonine dehydrogenase-like Zn-dependent dehydrogenase